MGRILAVVLVATFLFGAGAAYLPPPHWTRSLYLALVGLGALALCVVALLAHRRLGESAPRWAWALLPAGASVLLAGLSFLLGAGPGRLSPVLEVTIDVGDWAISGVGLAGALGGIAFGLAATACPRRWAGGLGGAAAVAGFLMLQPAMRELGAPTVGPLGLGIAIAAVALMRIIRS